MSPLAFRGHSPISPLSPYLPSDRIALPAAIGERAPPVREEFFVRSLIVSPCDTILLAGRAGVNRKKLRKCGAQRGPGAQGDLPVVVVLVVVIVIENWAKRPTASTRTTRRTIRKPEPGRFVTLRARSGCQDTTLPSKAARTPPGLPSGTISGPLNKPCNAPAEAHSRGRRRSAWSLGRTFRSNVLTLRRLQQTRNTEGQNL
jgi:hypothetical protein